jgi:hypothetical protein
MKRKDSAQGDNAMGVLLGWVLVSFFTFVVAVVLAALCGLWCLVLFPVVQSAWWSYVVWYNNQEVEW